MLLDALVIRFETLVRTAAATKAHPSAQGPGPPVGIILVIGRKRAIRRENIGADRIGLLLARRLPDQSSVGLGPPSCGRRPATQTRPGVRQLSYKNQLRRSVSSIQTSRRLAVATS